MGKQMILGSLLGAIVLFIWSTIAWEVIPWPGPPLRAFTNGDAVAQAIVANAPVSGTYLVPNIERSMTTEQQQKEIDKMTKDPIIFASVRLEPFTSMGKPLVVQFLTQLIVALIATFLLLQTTGLDYKCRVLFLTVIGLLIFVGGHVEEWNWWSFSNAYMLMQAGALLIGWFLASLVMSKIVKGKTAAA